MLADAVSDWPVFMCLLNAQEQRTEQHTRTKYSHFEKQLTRPVDKHMYWPFKLASSNQWQPSSTRHLPEVSDFVAGYYTMYKQ